MFDYRTPLIHEKTPGLHCNNKQAISRNSPISLQFGQAQSTLSLPLQNSFRNLRYRFSLFAHQFLVVLSRSHRIKILHAPFLQQDSRFQDGDSSAVFIIRFE